MRFVKIVGAEGEELKGGVVRIGELYNYSKEMVKYI